MENEDDDEEKMKERAASIRKVLCQALGMKISNPSEYLEKDQNTTLVKDEVVDEKSLMHQNNGKMSELDKIRLNLVWYPFFSEGEHGYKPILSSKTGMYYCNRKGVVDTNLLRGTHKVCPQGTCTDEYFVNCPSCRVFKSAKTEYITSEKTYINDKVSTMYIGESGLIYCKSDTCRINNKNGQNCQECQKHQNMNLAETTKAKLASIK